MTHWMTPAKKKKDPHAVAMGRKGGKARATSLGPDGCSEAARATVTARWDRVKAERAALASKAENRKRGRVGASPATTPHV